MPDFCVLQFWLFFSFSKNLFLAMFFTPVFCVCGSCFFVFLDLHPRQFFRVWRVMRCLPLMRICTFGSSSFCWGVFLPLCRNFSCPPCRFSFFTAAPPACFGLRLPQDRGARFPYFCPCAFSFLSVLRATFATVRQSTHPCD